MNDTQKIWLPEQREGGIVKIFAFLISPVLGILASLLRPNTKSSYLILFLSFITIGLAINVPDDRTDEMDFDSIAYRLNFEDFTSMSAADISATLAEYSEMGDSGATDIYAALVFYTVSRFSDNYHVCFMVIAIVFSIFMLKTMRYLVADEHYSFSVLCLILLFLFTMVQIQDINAFRFYTAYWIALYAILKIIMEKNLRYWVLLALTPFIHGSFFIIFIIFAMYYFFKLHHSFAIGTIIAGLLFSSIAVEAFSWIILHLPDSLGGHYGNYLNEWYIMRINEGTGGSLRWLGKLLELVVRISINVIGLYMAYHYNSRIAETKYKPAYFMMLAFLAFVNFTFMLPSIGSRYVMFFFPLLAYVWLGCFSEIKRWNWVIYAFSSIYLAYFLILSSNVYQIPCLRYYIRLWDMDILYQSPIYLWFKYILFPPI